MSTRHTKERLIEVMMKVDPLYKEEVRFNDYIKNKPLFEGKVLNEADNYEKTAEPEEQQQITPEEERNALELNKKAETAVESDQDLQKGVINQDKKGVDIKVTVPTYKKSVADKYIESLKKLAKKLQLPEPVITEGAIYQRAVTLQNGERYALDVYDLTLLIDGMFKLPGNNKLVAVVDNMTDGSIEIDPTEPVPQEYLQSSGDCDYCHQERYRGKNFIVKDLNKNKYLRLGSSCVKKFVGIDPAKYIRTLDYLRDFENNMNGLEDDFDPNDSVHGGGSRYMSPSNRLIDIDKTISIIYDLIKRDGYEKKDWEYPERGPGKPWRTNQGKATMDKAELIINDKEAFTNYPLNDLYVKEFKTFAGSLDPLPPNIVTSKYTDDPNEEPFQWDKNEGINEYRAKVKQTVTHPNFRVKDAGFLASAINFFENEKKRQAERNERAGSVWIGVPGEKLKIPYARLTDVKSGESEWGTWYLWSFIDDKGNVLKKFGTLSEKFKIESAPENSPELFAFRKGDVFAFTAEIKKHDEYQGVKNTQLGRLSKM
ncbi:MAG: hypothetical protein WC333_02205 [Dehalococcoidia bacterium]|jgi:hypothetical protein